MTPRIVWSDEDIAVLRARYPHEPTAEIAAALGRTIGQVYQSAYRYGLKKTAEYLASPAACRLRRGDNVGAEHRFKRGCAVWNAGLKGYQPGGRSVETRFKKGTLNGRARQLAKPIGAERVSKDGILQRKVHNGLPMQSRWKAVHSIIWEEANGPVPPGHIVVFRDHDRRNFELANLELITFAENMMRNTYHNYPKEIALAIQLRGALNRKIKNRIGKAA